MTAAGCGASRLLRHGGPVAVPFRACCAAALVRAGAGGADEPSGSLHAPFLCAADGRPGLDASAGLLTAAAAVAGTVAATVEP